MSHNNQGIIYNSIVSIQSLISAGFLDINNTNPNLLSQHLNYIFESLRWIYSQRIAKSSQYYGWGYSGDTKKEIYIMPTVHVLVTFKQVYYKLLFNWKRQIDTVVDDNKSLLNIINEIQNSLLYFRISPESGWGKTIDETDKRMVYTLLCLYGLSYSEIATPEINSPEEKLTVADINLFAKKLCNWRKRGLFNTEIINSLPPEEFFDSYIQMTSQGTKNNIVDHETFFETITLLSILEYIKRYTPLHEIWGKK